MATTFIETTPDTSGLTTEVPPASATFNPIDSGVGPLDHHHSHDGEIPNSESGNPGHMAPQVKGRRWMRPKAPWDIPNRFPRLAHA
jgi:hypothetical protein